MTVAQRTKELLASFVQSKPEIMFRPASDGAERRRQRRVQTLQPATVHVTSLRTSFPAKIRDFSTGGLGVVVNARIHPGETVIVEWHHGFLVGTVRHLCPAQGGWIAGVQLESMAAHEAVLTEMASSEWRARIEQLYAAPSVRV